MVSNLLISCGLCVYSHFALVAAGQ